jgi:hypothetical protein
LSRAKKLNRQILTLNFIIMETKQRTKKEQFRGIMKHPERDPFIFIVDKSSKLLLIPIYIFFIWVFYQIIVNS